MIDKALSDFLPDKTTSYFKEFDVSNSNITISKEQVIEELKKVMDPEIPVNLYDLGLIYKIEIDHLNNCLLYTSPSPRDRTRSRMPSSA